jgi:hypothetical protein
MTCSFHSGFRFRQPGLGTPRPCDLDDEEEGRQGLLNRSCPPAVCLLLPRWPRPPILSGTLVEENEGHMREYVCAKHLVGWDGSEVAGIVCLVRFVSCHHSITVSRDVLADRISYLADTGRASTLTTCLIVWVCTYVYPQTAGLVSSLSHEDFTLLKQTQQATHPRLSLSSSTDGASHHVIIVGY